MARQFYDEMYDAHGKVRPHYREFSRWLAATPPEQLAQRQREADRQHRGRRRAPRGA